MQNKLNKKKKDKKEEITNKTQNTKQNKSRCKVSILYNKKLREKRRIKNKA